MTTTHQDWINEALRDYVDPEAEVLVQYQPKIADLRDILLTQAVGDQWITGVQNFLGATTVALALTAIGLGTGASPQFTGLTLTGALVVDTSTLVVDPSNDRVGIGTANPAYTLDVAGTVNAGTIYTTTILRTTADGADSSSVTIGGGGAATTARGAVLTAWGNESGGAGSWQAFAGDVAGGSLQLYGAGNLDGLYRGYVAAYGGGTAETTSARMVAYGGAHASAAGNLYLASGSAGVGYYYAQTSDGADNRAVHMLGGGGLTNFSARGAYASAYGNEAAGLPGVLQIGGGDVADGGVRIAGAGGYDGAYRGYSTLFGGVSAATGARVLAFGNAHANSPGDLYLTAGTGNVYVGTSTSDGSDNKVVSIGAGGGWTSGRGAYAQLGGNENGSIPGFALVYGGDVADGGVRLYGAGNVDASYRGMSLVYGGVSAATGAYVGVYGNAHATLAGRLVVSSGSAGDAYLQTGTSGGSDNRAVYIAAGTAASITRCAWISAGGNEHATIPGELTLSSGLAGNVSIQAGTNDTADNRYVRLAGGGGFAGTRGAQLLLYGNENGGAGAAQLIAGEAGSVSIYVASASGSDSRAVQIAGGGAVGDASRGAYVNVYGINHATQAGRIILAAGTGGSILFEGTVLARTDNTYTLGGASNRWSTVYAVTGTINTSDATEKAWRGAMNDNEYRAASRIAGDIGVFQWLAAIEEKGAERARYHVGVTAQAVQMAFAAEGLDPARYGAWCIDAVTHEDGSTSTRQGLRFDQLAMFMIAAGLKKIDTLEERVALLEAA